MTELKRDEDEDEGVCGGSGGGAAFMLFVSATVRPMDCVVVVIRLDLNVEVIGVCKPSLFCCEPEDALFNK